MARIAAPMELQATDRRKSLPHIRQDKVRDIRRRIAEGTYEVGERLDEAMDRVLEALTRQSPRCCCCRHEDSNAGNRAVCGLDALANGMTRKSRGGQQMRLQSICMTPPTPA